MSAGAASPPDPFVRDVLRVMDRYRVTVAEDFGAIPEDLIWKRPVPGQVSPANLVLHLTGNLRHFFGHLLGGTGYARNRDREFLDEAYAGRDDILAGWETAHREVRESLLALGASELDRPAPIDIFPGGGSTRAFVLGLLSHLTYHAGQIRSLRRLLAPIAE
jgi:hypothetical protein